MTARSFAATALGIYAVILAAQGVLSASYVLTGVYGSMSQSSLDGVIDMCLLGLPPLAVAAALFLTRDRVADVVARDTAPEEPPTALGHYLSIGLCLLGAFMVATAVPVLVDRVYVASSSGDWKLERFVHPLATGFMGAAFVFGAPGIRRIWRSIRPMQPGGTP